MRFPARGLLKWDVRPNRTPDLRRKGTSLSHLQMPRQPIIGRNDLEVLPAGLVLCRAALAKRDGTRISRPYLRADRPVRGAIANRKDIAAADRRRPNPSKQMHLPPQIHGAGRPHPAIAKINSTLFRFSESLFFFRKQDYLSVAASQVPRRTPLLELRVDGVALRIALR